MSKNKKTLRRKKKTNHPRNELCHCGSGKTYYLCHYAIEHETTLHTGLNCKTCGVELTKNVSNDLLVIISNGMLKWHNYYKSHNLYKFTSITLGHLINLEEKEKNEKILSKKDLFEIYIDFLTKEQAFSLLDLSCEFEEFSSRKEAIREIIEAHFDKKFTLTVTASFAIIEGIIRQIQKIPHAKDFQCNFDKEIFLQRGLLMIADDVNYFNSFINRLFEGQAKPELFNRNPILHGISTISLSEEHSLILLLSVFEISYFLRWQRKENLDLSSVL
ncbi:SEC-C domain-containing protein [Leptospira yasudae]|uniref:SEC-C metal-binding domain-containing protein n=1 Tax=Leptospira yasudae TaxID=2202201 RepID=UPI0010833580|nr:SEC-C metal-binding domain-containing protein [Leptospira yasudae]TGK23325.1 SEC-C domain-containing protein [Leptospira yasudae]TGM09802.1 SEC-C domain-containing protein [Leptospira yasudae]